MTPLSTCFTGTISAFAASGSSLFAGSLGVCLTSDGGEHWSLVNAGLSSRDDVSTFATNHSGLYLGTFRTSTHPVYWLPENDTNWIAISGNLPTPVYIASLAALDACS